jgi:hypothetical protein
VLTRPQFVVAAFCAAFDESLYPSDVRRPGRERIIDEMTAFFIHGTAHRPDPARPTTDIGSTDTAVSPAENDRSGS